MKLCGATTLKGEPCRKGWGCEHHKNHGNDSYIAKQQADEAARGPIEDTLFSKGLTAKEIEDGKKGVAMMRALLSKKSTTISACGCEGKGE